MKKTILFSSLALAFSAFATSPKYVFLFIGDGMSTPQRMVADEFSRKAGNGPLSMNILPVQATTRTCSANSLVTDSAAAATAIACGVKTYNGGLGVDAKGNPVVSCAEFAKKAGKKVGITSTVTLTHATPGGFYAHRKSRGDNYGICLDLARSGFDFFAGGGLDYSERSARNHEAFATCGDPYGYSEKQGYRIVKTKAEFMALKPSDGKILTNFTNGPLETAIDITPGLDQPTLAEIVAKAIEMLDCPAGFFLMAEGGRIDWSGHANDAATNLRDVLALDEAVKVALAFQEAHPEETLVVVTGDHETGGMSMGFAGTGYALYMERLVNQTCSIGKFDAAIAKLFRENPALVFEDVKPLITKSFGFVFEDTRKSKAGKADPMLLSKAELREIVDAFQHDCAFHKAKVEENDKYDGEKRYLLGGACRLILSHKSGIGWSSGAHTAMPVLTTAKGCEAQRFSGLLENTDISKIITSFYVK